MQNSFPRVADEEKAFQLFLCYLQITDRKHLSRASVINCIVEAIETACLFQEYYDVHIKHQYGVKTEGNNETIS